MTAASFGMVGAAGPAGADPLGCTSRDESEFSTAVDEVDSRSPVVLVHGWKDSSKGMEPIEDGIEARRTGEFTFFYFDYRGENTDWAAHPRVASCLAHYIRRISDANLDAGGDGRVHVVTHSMGGLATRFATDSAYTDQPVDSSMLAGVTTIATPHLGSPWGGTVPADVLEFASNLTNTDLMFDGYSDAAGCLAMHGPGRPLRSCATPPYLPDNVRVDQIAGDAVLQRTLFGVPLWGPLPLYDIDLRSDGVVGVDSATGYLLGSGPADADSPRAKVTDIQITCKQTSDTTLGRLRELDDNLPRGFIESAIRAMAQLGPDSAILDEIASGTLGVASGVTLLLAELTFACSHEQLPGNDDALDAVAAALDRQVEAARDPGAMLGGWTSGTGKWTDQVLTITPTSLGAVRLGMSIPEAEQSAGVTLTSVGDGLIEPVKRSGNTYVSTLPDGAATLVKSKCLLAQERAGVDRVQAIRTRDGLRLGDSLDTLTSIYGERVQFVPKPDIPPGFYTPREGYVLHEDGGVLVFFVDSDSHRVTGIGGGPADLQPTYCIG